MKAVRGVAGVNLVGFESIVLPGLAERLRVSLPSVFQVSGGCSDGVRMAGGEHRCE